MNKKGFTLIELLSVVTLIVLISLIVLPNVVSNINKKKGELSEANMKLLSQATDVYIGNHGASYTNSFEADGSVYCISIQSLINDGVLETPFKDVSSNGSCTEFINYVSRPVLASSMIPVINDNGVWKKADVNSKWYSYSDKKWANAVVVKEFKSDVVNSHSRYEYLESPAGTVINDDDILGFYVWIPRFRYQLFNSSTPVPINLVFEGVGSSKSNGTQSGQWLTHPAFTYKDKELSGIWVGKYEAGNSDDNIVVKSGNVPWTNIGFNDSFDLSNSMVNENNIYGLSNVNTHLIQNKEWSSVTYLTQSIYGLNDKVNTNSSSVTGGTNSTTGNVYGVYDMAGLSKEFVTITGENENSIGYSLGETSAWYNDTNTFISAENSYLSRGGTSIFNYNASNVKNANTSFRPVIINNEVSSDNQNTSLQYAYLNVNTNSYYSTLQDAFSEAHNGDTIKVVRNNTDTSTPVLASDKTVIFEIPNGYTLALSGHYIENYGSLTVKGLGTLTSTVTVIRNDGILNVQDGILIKGIGTGTNSAINNFGSMTVTNASIASAAYRSIYNQATGILVVGGNDTNITASNYAIYNIGTANSTSNPAVKVEGGIVSSTSANAVRNNSTGAIDVSGGDISSISSDAIGNASTGSIDISGGIITGGTGKAGVSLQNGTMSITGGTVTGATYGVWMSDNNAATLNLGTDDGAVVLVPTITATNSTGKGIYVGIGTLNFYDGTVIGGYSGGTGYSIPTGGTINTASGYSISKTNDGSKETAVLNAN